MKLRMNFLPSQVSGQNFRRKAGRMIFQKVKEEVFRRAKNRCEICGSDKQLRCEELWDFDEERGYARLKGIICLCSSCFYVRHFDVARTIAGEGWLYLDELKDHFLAVNNGDLEDFNRELKRAESEYLKLAEKEWQIDYGAWNKVLYEESSKDGN